MYVIDAAFGVEATSAVAVAIPVRGPKSALGSKSVNPSPDILGSWKGPTIFPQRTKYGTCVTSEEVNLGDFRALLENDIIPTLRQLIPADRWEVTAVRASFGGCDVEINRDTLELATDAFVKAIPDELDGHDSTLFVDTDSGRHVYDWIAMNALGGQLSAFLDSGGNYVDETTFVAVLGFGSGEAFTTQQLTVADDDDDYSVFLANGRAVLVDVSEHVVLPMYSAPLDGLAVYDMLEQYVSYISGSGTNTTLSDGCFPAGYDYQSAGSDVIVKGTSNFEVCKRHMGEFINELYVSHHCPDSATCRLPGVQLPEATKVVWLVSSMASVYARVMGLAIYVVDGHMVPKNVNRDFVENAVADYCSLNVNQTASYKSTSDVSSALFCSTMTMYLELLASMGYGADSVNSFELAFVPQTATPVSVHFSKMWHYGYIIQETLRLHIMSMYSFAPLLSSGILIMLSLMVITVCIVLVMRLCFYSRRVTRLRNDREWDPVDVWNRDGDVVYR